MARRAFVTVLASENFLPGVIALCYSLRQYDVRTEIVVLSTARLDLHQLSRLSDLGVIVVAVERIPNPWTRGLVRHRFESTFTKLRIFDLIEFDKLVYIDADMLVARDITCLFSKPHLSAVKAGSLVAEHADWARLNSGLMVIVPDRGLFHRMCKAIRLVESIDRSDQGFLQNYYPDWERDNSLHLDHGFNVPAPLLDDYALQGFSFSFRNEELSIKNISILHYWGPYKPWNIRFPDNVESCMSRYHQAVRYWQSVYRKSLANDDRRLHHH